MTQEFMITAPELREAFDFCAIVPQMLLEEGAKSLELYLAVPVCPSFPNTTPTGVAVANTTWNAPTNLFATPSPFRALPPEIHHMIFRHLDAKDIWSLCHTSGYFCSFGLEVLTKEASSHLGRWAGESLICMGEEMLSNDCPKTLQECLAYLITCDTDVYGQLITPFNVASATYRKVEEEAYVPTQIHRDIDPTTLPFMVRAQISNTIHAKDSVLYPTDEPWVLRNLTTKEYVRAEDIAMKPEYIHGPFIDYIGFGEVVCSRIFWSSSSETGLEDLERDIHRGVWAGHRFDITTLARHERTTRGETWSDVGKEVYEELVEIFKNELGDDWAAHISPDFEEESEDEGEEE